MNGKDIFLGLQYVETAFIEEAENGVFSENARKETKVKRISFRKALLIAAVIALSLLLVGCGVAYVMHMQDLKIGEKDVSRDVFNERMEFQGFETVNAQILTLSGLEGSPNYQAAKEWFEFKQQYDPDGAIQTSTWGKEKNFPAEYFFYRPYTQEMVDKLDEIAQKYNLKLMGKRVEGKTVRALMDYVGVKSILRPDAPADVQGYSGDYYDGGYFYMNCYLQMDAGEGVWPYKSMVNYMYSKKDCFDDTIIELAENENWQERNYTTASGENLLILRSPDVWESWVFCDRGDATIALQMETIDEVYTDEKGYQEILKTPMTDGQLNQILDTIDFTLTPQPGDPALLTGLPAGTDAAQMRQTQNGVTVEVKSVDTDGYRIYVNLGLTAPEDVSLMKENGTDTSFHFETCCVISEASPDQDRQSSFGRYYIRDDGDGLSNTVDCLVEYEMSNGNEKLFADGTKCNLYLQNMSWLKWNSELSQFDETSITEGVWSFDFTIQGGDYREVEFVSGPVITSGEVGSMEDGSPVFDDVTITSLKLRAYSGEASFAEGGWYSMCDFRSQKFPQLVLKDGTSIALIAGWEFTPADDARKGTPLPLDDIDYLLLIDGTKLTPVG